MVRRGRGGAGAGAPLTWLALALLAGCSTLGATPGAIPIAPGTQSFAVAASAQRGSSALTTALNAPLPRIEVAWRTGLREDLDVGLRLYPVGALADARYRVLQRGSWHLAVAPGLGGSGLALPGLIYGNLDVHLPTSAEVELSGGRSLSLQAGAIARQQFVFAELEGLGRGAGGRYELLAGGAVGWSWGEARRWTASARVMDNRTRSGPPLFAAGIEVNPDPAGR